MEPPHEKSGRFGLLNVATLLVVISSFCLLTWQLDRLSLWQDELATARVVSSPSLPDVLQQTAQAERRPPLHYLFLHEWTQLAGASDFSLRFPSALFGVLSVVFCYRVGRDAFGRTGGVGTAALLAWSPFFVLYARFARYYSLVLLLATISTWAYLRLCRRPNEAAPSRGLAGTYVASALALALTDYVAPSLLFVHLMHVVFSKGRGLRRLVVLTAVAAFLLVGAWFVWAALRASLLRPESPTYDAVGGIVRLGLQLAYPAYSYGVGQTLFPWHPWAILALLSSVWLILVALWRWRGIEFPVALGSVALPLVGIILLATFVARDVPWTNLPSRAIAAYAAFPVVIIAGLAALRRNLMRGVAAALIIVGMASGLWNYFAGAEFHNPAYLVPGRALAAEVSAEAEPTDIVIADGDSGFARYYDQVGGQGHLFSIRDLDRARQAATASGVDRVWLITFERDPTEEPWNASQLRYAREATIWLQEGFQVVSSRQYVLRDPTYRQIKALLTQQSTYEYKVGLRLYARRSGAN